MPTSSTTKRKGTNHQGILMVIAYNDKTDRFTTSYVCKSKLQVGKQMRGKCVHAVGGTRNATLTPKRREAEIAKHTSRLGKTGLGRRKGRCSLHCVAWKKKGRKGAA